LHLLRLPESRKTVLCSHPCCGGRYSTACGVTRKAKQLEEMAKADGNASDVVKAVIWLKENFDKPFSIRLIAQEVNMSPSGLHHHFKTLTNMTPLQYQKHLRLQEARRLMLIDAMDASAAAYHVGYVSR